MLSSHCSLLSPFRLAVRYMKAYTSVRVTSFIHLLGILVTTIRLVANTFSLLSALSYNTATEGGLIAQILLADASYGRFLALNILQGSVVAFSVGLSYFEEGAMQLYVPQGIFDCLSGELSAFDGQWVYFALDATSGMATSFTVPLLGYGLEFVRV